VGTAQLLNTEVKKWRRIWQRSAARPQALPARIATFATVPVDMPRAPGHEVRIIGVTAVGKGQFAIDDDGQSTGVVA
jgi:hypothetical protein